MRGHGRHRCNIGIRLGLRLEQNAYPCEDEHANAERDLAHDSGALFCTIGVIGFELDQETVRGLLDAPTLGRSRSMSTLHGRSLNG